MQMGKREGHYDKWKHGKESYFDDDGFDVWCKLMCGVLFFFCEEFQVTGRGWRHY